MFVLSLFSVSPGLRYTVIINPLSAEQSEGPKNVNAVFSGASTALVISPQSLAVPFIKDQRKELLVVSDKHALQL